MDSPCCFHVATLRDSFQGSGDRVPGFKSHAHHLLAVSGLEPVTCPLVPFPPLHTWMIIFMSLIIK